MKRAIISKNTKYNANNQMRVPHDHIKQIYFRVKFIINYSKTYFNQNIMITFKRQVTVIMFGIIVFSSSMVNSQTKKDAADVYNQGVVANQNKQIDSAIIYFEKSIDLSEKVGLDAKDVKDQATKILPYLYFDRVAQLTKDRKFPECIAASKLAIAAADKYGSDTIKNESLKIMSQVYNSLGTQSLNNKEPEKALSYYDSSLAINPNYTKAIVGKANAYIKIGNNDKFAETIDMAIKQYKDQNDTTMAAKLGKVARDYFRSQASKANQANKLPDAISDLNTAVKYGYDKDIYYIFADVYNKEKKFDDALTNAQKGLDLETGDEVAKAKYYYQIGVAQLGKGDKDNACSSFKSAQFGAFAQAAKAQMINNKCPGTEPPK